MPVTGSASPAYATHSVVRAVAPPDAPFDGVIARAPDGSTVFLVERDRLQDCPAWRASAGGHILAPLDLLRRPDGHDVVLPAVSERLDRLLARRRASGAALADGEIVTVAVSILRGLDEVRAEELPDEAAAWWVSPEGKPLLAYGTGEGAPARVSAALVAALAQDADDAALRAVLDDIGRGLASPRGWSRELDGWEEALFTTAAPEPLLTEVLGPARPRRLRNDEDEPTPVVEQPRRAWWSPLASAVDAGWAEAASDLVHRARRTLRRAPGRRLRPALWGLGAAGAVLIVGLSWPDAEPRAAADAEATVAATAAPTEPAASSGSVPSADAAPEEPGQALSALLSARDRCADDGCRAAANEDAAERLPGGAIDDPARSIQLLDDFGGLAVLRVDAAGQPSQLVTIVTTPQGWRVRDVFDAADPAT